jgi:tetratricopeptide (TPR) repeat protein
MHMKIAVYSIAKNEGRSVQRWCDSNIEADLRIVCDTGSTDDTVELLERNGITVHKIDVIPWRFDTAKNMALDLVPDDYDIVISQDLDEALLPGWRQELEKRWEPDARILNHRYRNNQNPWQWHSKIHNRRGCKWVGAVHETLEWSIPDKTLWCDTIFLDEQQDAAKSRANYIELLHLKIDEGDRDWKTFYFLANEYMARGNLENAIKYRTQSLDLCNDGSVSRSYVAKNTALNYQNSGQPDKAREWYVRAVAEGNERESWYSYALFLYMRNEWKDCLEAAERCIAVTEKRNGYTFDPRAWSDSPYDIAAIAAYNCERHSSAIEYGRKAIELNPDDARLKQNQAFYEMRQDT